jgi:diguanylate cyclase (GGDEF)-like protein
LLFLDLDNFKLLNDKHGHPAGDLLLVEAARRLENCMREMDTLARFGGDEFVIMLVELAEDEASSKMQAGIVAEKVCATLSEPYVLAIKSGNQFETIAEHCFTASIGVALFIDYEYSLDNVLKWADASMYQAKEAGRNQIRFYGI